MYKKTKIVATIGPASENKENLRKMIKGGMNVVRLNFSHGEHKWHKSVIKTTRELSYELGVNIGILADLQGPRIRIQTPNNVTLRNGETIFVGDTKHKKNITNFSSKIFYLDYPGIIEKIKEGSEILIEDGLIKVKVIKGGKQYLQTKVVDGGVVKNHKGVNIPGADINIPVVTSKDQKDLKFALKEGVDFVALSFVRNGNDIKGLKKRIERIVKNDKNIPQVISKIERKEAIDNLDDIIIESDAIMVARGDLGIEINEAKVVVLQKEIIKRSLMCLKPVIVATQMLDSMIKNPRPTRAEVSDVSNAVIDHTDAIMLSGESANGKYPLKSIKIMAEIARETEHSPFDDIYKGLNYNIESDYAVVVKSAYELARSFDAEAILAISISGFTARLISHFRPEQKILIATNNKKTFNQLSLLWGVEGYLFENDKKLDTLVDKMVKEAKNRKRLKKGHTAVVIMGRGPKGEKMQLVGVRTIK